ncbi:MAG: hypothetical protein KY456_10830 [Chloroflexi bacterium]|nr:hypothetical protein [Chloroflexota bacterium]
MRIGALLGTDALRVPGEGLGGLLMPEKADLAKRVRIRLLVGAVVGSRSTVRIVS